MKIVTALNTEGLVKTKSFLLHIHHHNPQLDDCLRFCSTPGSKQIPNFFQINLKLPVKVQRTNRLTEPKQKHNKDKERGSCISMGSGGWSIWKSHLSKSTENDFGRS